MKVARPPAKRQKKTPKSPSLTVSARLPPPPPPPTPVIQRVSVVWKGSNHVLRPDGEYDQDRVYDRLDPDFAADFDMGEDGELIRNVTHNGVFVQIHNAYRSCAEIREFSGIAHRTCMFTHIDAYRHALATRRRQLEHHAREKDAPQKIHLQKLDDALKDVVHDIADNKFNLTRQDCLECLRNDYFGNGAFDECFAPGDGFETASQFMEIYDQAKCIQEACADLCGLGN